MTAAPGGLAAAVYGAALVTGALMALLQPALSRVDEAAHYDVMAQYAHGTIPVMGATTVRSETLAVIKTTGVVRWDLDSLPQPEPSPSSFATFEAVGTVSPSALSEPCRSISALQSCTASCLRSRRSIMC